MALGTRCDSCGAEVPSLGSLQMHELRYHSGQRGATPPTGPQPSVVRASPAPIPRKNRSAAIAPLALAVVALLSGGAFAATRARGADGPSLAELQAAAHRAVFTSGDFPVGWTAKPLDSTDDTGDADDRALAECMGTTYEDSPTEAQSSFSSAGLTAASDFSIASSAERARADFAALAGPAAAHCFEQMMRKVFDAGKPAGDRYELAVTQSALAAGLPRDAAHDAVGLRLTATLHRGKVAVPVSFETVMVRSDRIEATVMFSSIGSPDFPADLASTLTDAAVHRLG